LVDDIIPESEKSVKYIYVDGTTTVAQLQISLKSVVKSRKS
jgi:hypothetical protein